MASVYQNHLKRPQPVTFGKQVVRVVNPSQVKHVAGVDRRTASKARAQSICSNVINIVSVKDEGKVKQS